VARFLLLEHLGLPLAQEGEVVVRCAVCRAATPFAEQCQWCGRPLPPVPPQEAIPEAEQGGTTQGFLDPLREMPAISQQADPVRWVIALLTGLLVFWFAYSPAAGRVGMLSAAILAGGVAVAVSAMAQSIGQGTIGAALAEAIDERPEARLWSSLGAVCGMASVTMYPLVLGPVGIVLGYVGERTGAKTTGPAAMLIALCGAALGVVIAARTGPVSPVGW